MCPKHPSNFAALWESKDFSDLTIECGGRSFQVHKSMLCMSVVFTKMLTGPWKEANSSTIPLEEEPDVLETLLKFFYYAKIHTPSQVKTEPVFYAKLYGIADKYDVQTLVKLSKDKLESVLRTCSIEEFVVVLRYAQSNLPPKRELRTMLICRAKDHIIGLSQNDEFKEYLRDDPGLACELMFSYAHQDKAVMRKILSSGQDIELLYSQREEMFKPRSDKEVEDKHWRIVTRTQFQRMQIV